jgi:hypothetical protein
MATLTIQIQRDDRGTLVERVLSALIKEKTVKAFGVERGKDGVSYTNLSIDCKSGIKLWEKIGPKLNRLPSFKKSSVVVTTGKAGWDDFTLIQSFKELGK